MASDCTSYSSRLPAPCIVDSGVVVNKRDMKRLLCDLGPVHYRYTQGDRCMSEGKGYVVEVFSDPDEATLVTNHSLYLNVSSFDYLELAQTSSSEFNFSDVAQQEQPDGSTASFCKNQDSSSNVSLLQSCFYLVQENVRLQLVPLMDPLKTRRDRTMNVIALEAVVADMLSANLDISESEDDEPFSF